MIAHNELLELRTRQSVAEWPRPEVAPKLSSLQDGMAITFSTDSQADSCSLIANALDGEIMEDDT